MFIHWFGDLMGDEWDEITACGDYTLDLFINMKPSQYEDSSVWYEL